MVATGLVFRDAVLKCKMLLNSEVWHSLTAQQVSVLESVDKTYLRSILRCHDKVAIECIYFEVGLLPYKYEIIRRRLMYLWKLLHVDKQELIYRVYRSQQLTSHPGDWVRLVNRDKEAIGL